MPKNGTDPWPTDPSGPSAGIRELLPSSACNTREYRDCGVRCTFQKGAADRLIVASGRRHVHDEDGVGGPVGGDLGQFGGQALLKDWPWMTVCATTSRSAVLHVSAASNTSSCESPTTVTRRPVGNGWQASSEPTSINAQRRGLDHPGVTDQLVHAARRDTRTPRPRPERKD